MGTTYRVACSKVQECKLTCGGILSERRKGKWTVEIVNIGMGDCKETSRILEVDCASLSYRGWAVLWDPDIAGYSRA